MGHTQKEIGQILGYDQSAISREIKRNRRYTRTKKGRIAGIYQATVAGHKARVKRLYGRYQGKKIEETRKLREYVIEKLKQHWNPDEISGRMKDDREPFYVSKTSIYEWLRSNRGQRYCAYLYSRKYRVKKHRINKTKKRLIPNRIGIDKRPLGANNKSRYGHYEGDTIVSGKTTRSTAALSVIYERKAKYIMIRKIKNLKSRTNNRAILEMTHKIKARSITFDNGIENIGHTELGVATFFCDPYSSWQKGGVENANKMIRRFIPKGSDISNYSNEYVMMVEDILNRKPRKLLGYKTPEEVMRDNKLFKNINPE